MAKFKIETSSGGVVYKIGNTNIEIALIKRLTKRGMHVWCLPKGKIENAETQEAAALREVNEETGIKGEIGKGLGNISYWFYGAEDKLKINKTVYFYLMKYLSQSSELHDSEVEEVRWFEINEAVSAASYKSEKGIIEKAKKVLESISGGDRE